MSLITALFLGYIVVYIDKISADYSLIPIEDEEQMQLSPETKGLIMGAFFIGYACMQIPMSLLSNRLGSKRIFSFFCF